MELPVFRWHSFIHSNHVYVSTRRGEKIDPWYQVQWYYSIIEDLHSPSLSYLYYSSCFLLLLIHTFSVLTLQLKKTTVTQQVSHRPIKYQSRLWSQRDTKVNGSHHGDNPLLRSKGIQIATKYAALQAMAPTNFKTVHQTSLLHIESKLDRPGMLSPTHD